MSWEEVGSDAVAARSPRANRRCTGPKRCERYARHGEACYCGGTFAPVVEVAPEQAGRATHGHEVACRRRGEGGYLPPSAEELREYEGPHD